MKFRSLVLSVLAIGCGLGASILTARYLNSSPGESHVTVLVAQKLVPRGCSLRDYESLFVPKEVPSTSPLPFHYVRSFEELREKARDHLVAKEMKPGEPLSQDYLIDRKAGLEYLLRPGFVAFAVRATPESSFAGLIQPENLVKVLRVKTAGAEKRAEILMKNIRVLAVDRLRDKLPDGAGHVPSTITLEVTDQEAKTLNLAQLESPLAFALIAHASEHELNDRTGEADVYERREPLPPRPVVVEAAPSPAPRRLADHRVIVRQGARTEVFDWSDELKRFFHSETLTP